MQAHFQVSEITERAQAAFFSTRFGVDMERIPQGPGIVGDYIVLQTSEHTQELENALGYPLLGRRIEFKNDKTSVKYNSFFVEFEQTSDFWTTRKTSGHALAIQENCVLVLSSGTRCFVFNEHSYAMFMKGITRVLSTKFRSNGNSPASFTHGKVVPIKRAVEEASFLYNMSEHPTPHTGPLYVFE